MGRASGWVELAHVNGLIKPSLLLVGQVLTIPQRGSALRLPEGRSTHSVLQGGPAIEVVGELGVSPAGSVPPHETEARLAPARGFMFVVFEQLPDVGTGKIIERSWSSPRTTRSIPPTLPGP
jgi:hypothetical protein